MRTTGIKGVLLVVTLALLHSLVTGDAEVTCVLRERCILPCKFQFGNDTLIHWIHLTAGINYVHSYYYGEDQFINQGQRFKNRTSLFKDEITRGNASLVLTQVEPGDQGRYKCHTSVPDKPEGTSFINLKVDDAAPVTPTSVLPSSTQPNFTTKAPSENENNNTNIIIVVVICLGLAVIGLTGFLLHRRRQRNHSPQDTIDTGMNGEGTPLKERTKLENEERRMK